MATLVFKCVRVSHIPARVKHGHVLQSHYAYGLRLSFPEEPQLHKLSLLISELMDLRVMLFFYCRGLNLMCLNSSKEYFAHLHVLLYHDQTCLFFMTSACLFFMTPACLFFMAPACLFFMTSLTCVYQHTILLIVLDLEEHDC